MKIRNLLLLLLAFACLSSTANANFFSLLRQKIQDYKENTEWERPTRIRTINIRNNEQRPEWGQIWEKICGGENREWNFERPEECRRFDNYIEKFREICGDRREVENWCERIKEKVDWEPRYRCPPPRPPAGSAVPEPSTYGMIGAGALLGLIGFRRFKTKK